MKYSKQGFDIEIISVTLTSNVHRGYTITKNLAVAYN